MKRFYTIYQRQNNDVTRLQHFALTEKSEQGLMIRLGVLLDNIHLEHEIVVMSDKQLAARRVGEQEWELYELDRPYQ